MNYKRFMLYNMQFVGMGCLFLALVIHPLIHGTPLDSGLLDGFFTQLHIFGVSTFSTPVTLED